MKTRKYSTLILILLSAIIFVGWFIFNSQTPRVVINGQVIGVELALDDTAWSKGLSGHNSLAYNSGMLFIFPDKAPRSFWMKDMKFNIDLLWIDGNKIVGWEENMLFTEPLTAYPSMLPVDKVLELPAGSIDNRDFKIGDIIIFKNI